MCRPAWPVELRCFWMYLKKPGFSKKLNGLRRVFTKKDRNLAEIEAQLSVIFKIACLSFYLYIFEVFRHRNYLCVVVKTRIHHFSHFQFAVQSKHHLPIENITVKIFQKGRFFRVPFDLDFLTDFFDFSS